MESPFDQLIEIRVPTTDGSEVVATGYPVAPDRILTASHVLAPADRDEEKAIEVRWYHQRGNANAYRPVTQIVWDGRKHDEKHDDLDIALLECPFPDDVRAFVPLQHIAPQAHLQWDSEGFAKAVETGDSRPTVSLRGKMQRSASTSRQFDVNADPAPTLKKGWAGISGCPVFVGNVIVGVIVSVYGNFGNAKLSAVKISWLLDEERFPKFCKEVGWSRQSEWSRLKDLYADRIASELRQSDPIREFLEQSDRFVLKGEGDPSSEMAQAILGLVDEEACELLTDAFVDRESHKDTNSVATVARIAKLVLPALLDEDDAALVVASKGNPGHCVVEVRCSGRTLTELIMAQHDRRHARFRSRNSGQDELLGDHLIYAGPELGKASSLEADVKSFDDLLALHFLSDEERSRYIGDTRRNYNKIRLKKESRRATKYYAFHIEDLEKQPDLRRSIEEVKIIYPDIVFVQLQRPQECELRDAQLLADEATYRMLSYATE